MTTQVLLATYNGEKFLEEQLESILSQGDVDVLIADDGSTDGTVELIRSYSSMNRVSLEFESRVGGPVENFRRLLDLVDSPYFAFSDQDDVWLPDRVSKQRKVLEGGGTVAAFSDLSLIDGNGLLLHPSMFHAAGIDPSRTQPLEVLARNPMSGNATLFSSAILESARPIPPEVHMHDWWVALVAATRGRCEFTGGSMVEYRQHSQNVESALGRKGNKGWFSVAAGIFLGGGDLLTKRAGFARHLVDRRLVSDCTAARLYNLLCAANGDLASRWREVAWPSAKFGSAFDDLAWRVCAAHPLSDQLAPVASVAAS